LDQGAHALGRSSVTFPAFKANIWETRSDIPMCACLLDTIDWHGNLCAHTYIVSYYRP